MIDATDLRVITQVCRIIVLVSQQNYGFLSEMFGTRAFSVLSLQYQSDKHETRTDLDIDRLVLKIS